MPQRDAARATSAATAPSAVPSAVPPAGDGGSGGATAPSRPVAAHPAPEPPVDARALARASLAAGRSPSLWWVCTGIVVVLVVSFAVGATQGALVLAGLLAASA